MKRARCACGLPLHYSDPAIEAFVQQVVDQLGATVAVSTPAGVKPAGVWLVPRHFIALHGLALDQLPQLARLYRWEKT